MNQDAVETESRTDIRSYCRICAGFCGMILSVENGERIVDIKGDKDHPHSRGFACIKGLQAAEATHGARRLLRPLKRMPDGSYGEVSLNTALGEIAERLTAIVDIGPVLVEAPSGADTRFAAAAPDVVAELAEVAAESTLPADSRFTHRLVCRRLREVSNSMHQDFPAIRRRLRYNPAYMHSEDLTALGLASGEKISIRSDHGRIEAIVETDDDVRPGVISMAHSWGGLPGEGSYEQVGAYTGLLISTDNHMEPINAMPRQSAIPVCVSKLAAETASDR